MPCLRHKILSSSSRLRIPGTQRPLKFAQHSGQGSKCQDLLLLLPRIKSRIKWWVKQLRSLTQMALLSRARLRAFTGSPLCPLSSPWPFPTLSRELGQTPETQDTCLLGRGENWQGQRDPVNPCSGDPVNPCSLSNTQPKCPPPDKVTYLPSSGLPQALHHTTLQSVVFAWQGASYGGMSAADFESGLCYFLAL